MFFFILFWVIFLWAWPKYYWPISIFEFICSVSFLQRGKSILKLTRLSLGEYSQKYLHLLHFKQLVAWFSCDCWFATVAWSKALLVWRWKSRNAKLHNQFAILATTDGNYHRRLLEGHLRLWSSASSGEAFSAAVCGFWTPKPWTSLKLEIGVDSRCLLELPFSPKSNEWAPC